LSDAQRPARGRPYILAAASGTGKTTLARALIERVDNLAFSISHTTRPPRPGERDGVDYHFVNRETFVRMVDQCRFIEHARVFDNFYGTSFDSLETQLAAGNDVLLDIDWQGARLVREHLADVVDIFILPPSREELERRLRDRGQDTDAVIARRMHDAVSEMRHYDEFRFVVVNDDFDAALADLEAILAGEPAAVRPNRLDMVALLREPA